MKISLLLEDSLAAAAFLVAIGLLMGVLHIDEEPASSGSTYTSSFRKFPKQQPFKLDYPIRPKCEGVPYVGQRSDPFEPWQFECAPSADLTQRKDQPL